MKIIYLILFNIAALIGTVSRAETAFNGFGNEPFWSLTLTSNESQMFDAVFESANGVVESTLKLGATHQLEPIMAFYHANDRDDNFNVLIVNESCQGGGTGDLWSQTVTIVIGDTIYIGCGGEML